MSAAVESDAEECLLDIFAMLRAEPGSPVAHSTYTDILLAIGPDGFGEAVELYHSLDLTPSTLRDLLQRRGAWRAHDADFAARLYDMRVSAGVSADRLGRASGFGRDGVEAAENGSAVTTLRGRRRLADALSGLINADRRRLA